MLRASLSQLGFRAMPPVPRSPAQSSGLPMYCLSLGFEAEVPVRVQGTVGLGLPRCPEQYPHDSPT